MLVGRLVVLPVIIALQLRIVLSPRELVTRPLPAVRVVGQYDKLELTFKCPSCTAHYRNPNDPSKVDVEARFIAPSGKRQTVPGFFFQDFRRSGNITHEILTQIPSSSSWKVRFAPAERGIYSFRVTLIDHTGHGAAITKIGAGSFRVTASGNPGFIRASGYHLVRDNGRQFIPLGVNAPWFQYRESGMHAWGDGTYGVDTMYRMFKANGVNFFHLWTCSWREVPAGVPTIRPWAKPNISCNGHDRANPYMSQPDSWELDYMVDRAHTSGLYILPILKHVNQTIWSAADAIESRYFVARWGYSTNIVGWDFGKEQATDIATDHRWAAYMKSIDPYDHLRTTSQWNHYPTVSPSNRATYQAIFRDPLMTLVQTHDYTGDCIRDLFSDPGLDLFQMKLDPNRTDPRDFHAFGKPSFFGETGVHNTASLNPCRDRNNAGPSGFYANDRQGLILKSEIWAGLMASVTALPWTFKIDPQGHWTQLAAFKGIRAYADTLPTIPDNASLFSSYHDASQVQISDPRLHAIGRKNSTFAMIYVANTTGDALRVLRGNHPIPIRGTVTLRNMRNRATFNVTWFDTNTGARLSVDRIRAKTAKLSVALPHAISDSIAALVSYTYSTNQRSGRT